MIVGPFICSILHLSPGSRVARFSSILLGIPLYDVLRSSFGWARGRSECQAKQQCQPGVPKILNAACVARHRIDINPVRKNDR